MGSAQDEIRRRMKEAKQKPRARASHDNVVNGNTSISTTKGSNSLASAATPAIPVGFYDDLLADAKARKVDMKELAAKQLETEWEAFQEFATEVEQQAADEKKQQIEESKEREAIEQLENMEYVDRYRIVLEHAISFRKRDHNGKTCKRTLDEKSIENAPIIQAQDITEVSLVLREYKKQYKKARKRLSKSKTADVDLDLCNWRSRGLLNGNSDL